MDDPVFMYSLLMMAGVLLNIALCGAVISIVVKVSGGPNARTTQILRIATGRTYDQRLTPDTTKV